MNKLVIEVDEAWREFGDIVILEGDDNIFDEYNSLALAFREIYDNSIEYKVQRIERF